MSDWVDFAALKRSVPLALIFERYHVKLRRSGRDQYRGRCPIHRGEGPEAFHANLSRNIFHCFSCGAGGSGLDFVAALEGCTLREAALRLQHEILFPARLQPAATDNWLRKEEVRPRRWALLCAVSIARTPIWRRAASTPTLPTPSGPACIPVPESSAGGWSFPSTTRTGSWSPTAAARWTTPSRVTAFQRVSPNRKSCSTSTAPPRENPPWLW